MTVRDVCDITHSILRDQVERVAVADRQALMTVAVTERWEDYTPISVEERLDNWEAWLAHDPNDTQEARDERRIRELMEVA